ncbi:DinB family protein [Actinopolyspora erythraea]|uniref:DinB family protein n=1 Tax=Actinopolyspora erythraea TaxID=414996 RepID=A0A099D5A9_9ACTN|nr:DinB family protein [Actinopolyspora erythraea]ASU78607.1 DinB family protein [Actinopolyspora erythraea]KGI81368.1 Mini-circle protein [Actinopolyspora erythraea]
MSGIERPMPPLNADERDVLEGWLDFHRATLARKCEGLDDNQAATAATPPSEFTLTGLVQHMAEVERTWFRRVLTAEHLPPLHTSQAHPDGTDGGFELAEGATLHGALRTWHTEVEHSRRNCRQHSLTDLGDLGGQAVNLRWIYVHMIEEYARHNGHADLLRERIDGATGI